MSTILTVRLVQKLLLKQYTAEKNIIHEISYSKDCARYKYMLSLKLKLDPIRLTPTQST
jgi:hypothetical protein